MVVRRRLSYQAPAEQEHALFPDTTMVDLRSNRSKREREREDAEKSSRLSLRSRADAFNTTDRMPGRDFLDIIRGQGGEKDNQLYGATTRQNQMGVDCKSPGGRLDCGIIKVGRKPTSTGFNDARAL